MPVLLFRVAITIDPTTNTAAAAMPMRRGDFDFDGDVDGSDFLIWQRNPSVGSLVDWKANFGVSSLIAANAAVPEPASLVMLLAGFGASFFADARLRQRIMCK